VPLNIIFFLATRKNMTGLKRAVENIVRSTAFLTAYCTLAIATGTHSTAHQVAVQLTRTLCAWPQGASSTPTSPSR
jgi:hypothetical protein